MRRPNYVRAAAPWLGPCLALICAQGWAGRGVQDGVLEDGVPLSTAQVGAGLQLYSSESDARILDWTSDGALLVAVHEAGQDQMRRVTGAPPQAESQLLGAPGGMLRAVAAQSFHNEWVAYLGDESGADGSEGAPLSLRALAGGDAKVLVQAAARPGTPVWAHDGRRLAFSATLRDGKSTDLYVLDSADSAGPRLVASGNADARQVLAWTSADRALLVRHTIAGGGDELLLVDIESGAARRVDAPAVAASGYAHVGDVRLAPDDRGVYFVSDLGSAHTGLRYVDLYNNSTLELSATLGHEIEHFDVGSDNRSIAISWTEFGYSRIALLDRLTNGVSILPSLPPGAVSALRFDHGGTHLAVELTASTAPRDVYVCELGAKACTRWTESKLGQYTATRLIAPLTVRFPTWDRPSGSGSALTALLYRPRTPGPYPVLIMLNGHGTPPSAQLDPFVQYCVNELGIAVVAPGLRDGEAGVLDLGALLAWLGAQPDMRRDRVMVQGRGAGGTLALTGLGIYSDRLRAAVSVDGMASSVQIMPIRHPVLLVRGLNSPALDAASAEQLLWRLRSAKISSWFVAPRDRRDALSSEAEQRSAQRVIAQFVATQLGG
jgi:dipeptidyl aminopeptidase/acylaminoacyl peptidase